MRGRASWMVAMMAVLTMAASACDDGVGSGPLLSQTPDLPPEVPPSDTTGFMTPPPSGL